MIIHVTVAITKYDGRKMWKGSEPDTKEDDRIDLEEINSLMPCISEEVGF